MLWFPYFVCWCGGHGLVAFLVNGESDRETRRFAMKAAAALIATSLVALTAIYLQG